MTDFEDYPFEYKYLPIELLLFFSAINKGQDQKMIHRTVMEFCEYYKKEYQTKELPQPRIVGRICDILVDHGKMTVIRKGGIDNTDNSYLCMLGDKSIRSKPILVDLINNQLSCIIYGFKFIYNYYKKYVLPILHTDQNNDVSIGSCFLFRGGILTAKHCIEKAGKIAIRGINAKHIEEAKFYTLSKESMDLIFIKLPIDITNSIHFHEEASILDEVIALGYPQIPGFHNFMTGEKALVSSKITGSTGSVASTAEDIWIRENLLLITAKIKGGNSGGPIINRKGSVVGIASSLAMGEGNYDDLGYGTVIPITFGNQIIDNPQNEFDKSKIVFEEFKE